MNNKVYIVTSGQYSDYCIKAVYSNIEDAEKHASATSNDAFVEEWDLCDCLQTEQYQILQLRDKGYLSWQVYIQSETGNILRLTKSFITAIQDENLVVLGSGDILWRGYHKTEEEAIKVASEKWAEWRQRTLQETP